MSYFTDGKALREAGNCLPVTHSRYTSSKWFQETAAAAVACELASVGSAMVTRLEVDADAVGRLEMDADAVGSFKVDAEAEDARRIEWRE